MRVYIRVPLFWETTMCVCVRLLHKNVLPICCPPSIMRCDSYALRGRVTGLCDGLRTSKYDL